MKPRKTQHVLFWSGGGSIGSTAPFFTIAEAFAALCLPNVKVVAYSPLESIDPHTDNGVEYVGDHDKLLEMNLGPIFINVNILVCN